MSSGTRPFWAKMATSCSPNAGSVTPDGDGVVVLPGQDMVFLAHALLGPFDRQPMIAGEGFHPGLVVGGAPAEDLFVDHGNADHVPEECTTCSGRPR